MRMETITRGGREFALIPKGALKKLLKDSEILADIYAYDSVKARLESGEDELIPFEMVERRINGESPLKIWREYRDLTQEALAKKAKISRAMIAAIETGHKKGGVGTLKKLANILGVSLDNLA